MAVDPTQVVLERGLLAAVSVVFIGGLAAFSALIFPFLKRILDSIELVRVGKDDGNGGQAASVTGIAKRQAEIHAEVTSQGQRLSAVEQQVATNTGELAELRRRTLRPVPEQAVRHG